MNFTKIYNFDTKNKQEAIAALLVYSIYRSRDKNRFKVSPEMWGQIERFTKSSAKRAKNLQQFLEQFKDKMKCTSINPKWTEIGVNNRLLKQGDTLMSFNGSNSREFLTEIINEADHKVVLSSLLKETSWIIALVRDRLEIEKNIESTFNVEE